jgi:hypothetical protein
MGGWFRHYKTTSKPTKLANGHFTHTIGPRATHRGHFCFTNMPTCKGRPVQSTLCSQLFRARTYISSTHNLPPYSEWEWRPTISAHHIMAFLNHYATYCLAILWHYTKRVHHIGLPQSLCRILPCHIMALYQKGTPYWPSSIIMPHIALPYYGIIPKGYTIFTFLNHYAAYCLAI